MFLNVPRQGKGRKSSFGKPENEKKIWEEFWLIKGKLKASWELEDSRVDKWGMAIAIKLANKAYAEKINSFKLNDP